MHCTTLNTPSRIRLPQKKRRLVQSQHQCHIPEYRGPPCGVGRDVILSSPGHVLTAKSSKRLLSQPPSQLTSPPPQPMRLRCFYPAKTCLRHQCHKMSLRQLRDVQVHSVIIAFLTTRHNTLPSQPSKKRCRSRIRRGVPTLLCSARGRVLGSQQLCQLFPRTLGSTPGSIAAQPSRARKPAGNEKGHSDHFWEGRGL